MQRRQQRCKPRVAGTGGTDALDLVRRRMNRYLPIVQIATLDVELDADEPARHEPTKGGDHFAGLGLTRERRGFGAARGEKIELRQDRLQELVLARRINGIQSDARLRRYLL